MDNKFFLRIFIRYLIIVLAGLGNLFLFYKLLGFPTIHLSSLILSIFKETIIIDNFIIFGDDIFEIANSCIAGSAYYLLFVLSMSLPLKVIKRIKLVAFCFSVFFIVNVFRIVIMISISHTLFFEGVHLFLWHIFSTIFLLLIWFSATKIFKINEIPLYTDILRIKKLKNFSTRKKNN